LALTATQKIEKMKADLIKKREAMKKSKEAPA
jgi:hypothetical protein